MLVCYCFKPHWFPFAHFSPRWPYSGPPSKHSPALPGCCTPLSDSFSCWDENLRTPQPLFVALKAVPPVLHLWVSNRPSSWYAWLSLVYYFFFSLWLRQAECAQVTNPEPRTAAHTLLLCPKCSHQPLRSSRCLFQPPGHPSQHACGPTRSQSSSNTCTLVTHARPDSLHVRAGALVLKHGRPSCQATLQAAPGPSNPSGRRVRFCSCAQIRREGHGAQFVQETIAMFDMS